VGNLKQSISDAERIFILDTLRQTGWIKREAAKQLGISRTTLYRRLKRYEIRPEYQEQLDKMLARIQ